MNVKDIIYKKLNNLTKQNIEDSSNVNSIGIDSLDLVELVTELEEELNIEISDEQLTNIKTIKDVINIFEKAI